MVGGDFDLDAVHIFVGLLRRGENILALLLFHGHDTLLQALNLVEGHTVALADLTGVGVLAAELVHEEVVAELLTGVAVLSPVAHIISWGADHLPLLGLLRFGSHLYLSHALVEIEFLRRGRSGADPGTLSKVLLLCRGSLLDTCKRCDLQFEVLLSQPSVMVRTEMMNERHQLVGILLDALLLRLYFVNLASNSSLAAEHFTLTESEALVRVTRGVVLPLT